MTSQTHYNSVDISKLPHKLTQVISHCFDHPPLLACEGMPLHNAAIDHLALALPTHADIVEMAVALNVAGIDVVEPLHRWPDDIPECPTVPVADRKWMATFNLGEMLLVLLAPQSEDDLIARFVQWAGGPGIHHMAFQVDPIEETLAQLTNTLGVRQITPLAVDDDYLKQVFLKMEPDIRIIELIERVDTFQGTFTCSNIAALTAGERAAQG